MTSHTTKDKEEVFFKQYQMMVSSAEKVTSRRQEANRFFLAANTALLGITGYLTAIGTALPATLISAGSIAISLSWARIIVSFKRLNTAKFKVINDMERSLPVAIYTKEYALLHKYKYQKLTDVESWVPWVFVVLHSLVLLLNH